MKTMTKPETIIGRKIFKLPEREATTEERLVVNAALARGKRIKVPFDRSPRRNAAENARRAEEWVASIGRFHDLYGRFMRGEVAIQFVADEVMDLNPDTMVLLHAKV